MGAGNARSIATPSNLRRMKRTDEQAGARRKDMPNPWFRRSRWAWITT